MKLSKLTKHISEYCYLTKQTFFHVVMALILIKHAIFLNTLTYGQFDRNHLLLFLFYILIYKNVDELFCLL